MNARTEFEKIVKEQAWFLPRIWKRQTIRLIKWEETSDADRQALRSRLELIQECLALLPEGLSDRVRQLCSVLDEYTTFGEVAIGLDLQNIDPENVATWLEQLAPSFQPNHLATDEQRIIALTIAWCILPLDGKEKGDSERFVYTFWQPLCVTLAFHSASAHCAAVLLGESIAGIDAVAFADPALLKQRLDVFINSFDHPLHVAMLIYAIAYSVQRQPTRGRRQSVLLLECWMQVDRKCYQDTFELRKQILSGPLGRLPETCQTLLVELLANALNAVATPDAFAFAADLQEAWTGIEKTDYETPSALISALRESPLAQVKHQPVWGNTITTFAMSLSRSRTRGRSYAFRLLEVWLREWIGIQPEFFHSAGHSASEFIQMLQASLGKTTYAASVVNHLSSHWIDEARRVPHLNDLAESVLLAQLGLAADSFKSRDELRERFSDLDDPADNLLILNLAAAALGSKREAREITNLLETWLGTYVERFASSDRLTNVAPFTAMGFAQTWLRCAAAKDKRIPEVCSAVVDYAYEHRVLLRSAPPNQEDFLSSVSTLGQRIISSSLQHAMHLRKRNRVDEAESVERKTLEWAELFENSIFVEKSLRNKRNRSFDNDQELDQSDWPFAFATRSNDTDFRDGYLPVTDTQAQPLQTRVASTVDTQDPRHTQADPGRNAQANSIELTGLKSLCQLIPQNAVLFRALFDGDGRLHFWAIERAADGLRFLWKKTSKPDAFGRLRLAVLAFDLAVERAWVLAMTPPTKVVLNTEQFDILNFLGDLGSGNQSIEDEDDLQAALNVIHSLLEKLETSFPVLSRTGFQILVAVIKDVRLRRQRSRSELEKGAVQIWLDCLRDIRNSSSTLRQSKQECRRMQLDEATRALCEDAAREVSIDEMFSATQSVVDWGDQDVIFQMQWMLWSIPISSSRVSGKPFFLRVRSITNVVSLTWMNEHLRFADQSFRSEAKRILSAHWLSETDWRRPMKGLSMLHESIQRSASMFGWEVVGLAENPKASCENLAAHQNQESISNILLIGGHGSTDAIGIQLADGLWNGGGIAFSPGQVLVLAACAVGRVEQEKLSSIAGLYAELASNGCETVVSAKWPIADTEASQIAAELVRGLMVLHDYSGSRSPFLRARVLNDAKKKLFGTDRCISLNQVSAFELYGFG